MAQQLQEGFLRKKISGNNKEKPPKSFLANVIELVPIGIVLFIVRTIIFGLYIVPTGSMETTMLVGARFFADKFSYWVRTPVAGEVIAFNDPEYQYSKNLAMAWFEQYVWGPSNWTKRIIGVPGDEVRGAIEDGKPVIYINGKKSNEPYINRYPLIHVWTKDPDEVRAEVEHELAKYSRSMFIDQNTVQELVLRKLSGYTTWRSYDPAVAYNDQPFYRIDPERIIRDEAGNVELLSPQVPFPTTDARKSFRRNGDYWNGSDEFLVHLKPGEYWCMGDNRRGSKDCRVFGPISEKYIHGRILFQIWSIDSNESWWILDLLRHPIDFWTRIRWHQLFKWVV